MPEEKTFIFAYIGLAFLVGALAARKGRSLVGWMMLSLVVTPLLSYAALALIECFKRSKRDERYIR